MKLNIQNKLLLLSFVSFNDTFKTEAMVEKMAKYIIKRNCLFQIYKLQQEQDELKQELKSANDLIKLKKESEELQEQLLKSSFCRDSIDDIHCIELQLKSVKDKINI